MEKDSLTVFSELKGQSPEFASMLLKVRELILAYGWNSTAYQIINPGIIRWFPAAGRAVVGYVKGGSVRVVAGAPVCAEDRLPEIISEFEDEASRAGEHVCYLAAESRLEGVCAKRSPYTKLLLGAQPVWHPSAWPEIVAKHKSLRAQVNRARNKNVTVNEWPTEKAHSNPLLKDCLHNWLEAKGLPPLHFMVEPDTLSRLFDRRIFVAECRTEIVGFVIISPVPQRKGWLFEQFVYQPGAPNGTVELMIDTAMRALAEDGYEYATLGLSPLSTRAKIVPFRNPPLLRFLIGWARLHGNRFYNFNGLDAFKAKLQPESWEPIFAISNEPRLSLRTIYAIAAAFSGNRPFKLLVGGLWRAVKTELRWLKQKFEK